MNQAEFINLLNNSGFAFFFLVVDPQLNITLPELTHFQSLVAPAEIKNSGHFLSQPQTLLTIKTYCQQNNLKPAIISFKPSAKIDHLCRVHDFYKVCNDSAINRLLEDKIKFFQICQQHHLPLVPSLITTFTENNFIQAQKQLGSHLVVQTHFGWAGNSTHSARSFSDIKDLIAPDVQVKISPFLRGYSLLNNCALIKYGLLQSPPALQYTGLPQLTQNPFATVGRQWPSFAPTEIINQVVTITQNFSTILTQNHFVGFFGLDFLVSDNQVYLLECNPRLTASFAFYTDIEKKNNLVPLFYYHLADFLHLDYTPDHSNRSQQNLVGSEITRKNESGVTIAKFNDFVAFTKTTDPISIPENILNQVL